MLSKTLKELRQQKGYTLRQLGDLCGVSASTLSRLELGTADPPLSLLVALAQAYDMGAADLLALAGYALVGQDTIPQWREITLSVMVLNGTVFSKVNSIK